MKKVLILTNSLGGLYNFRIELLEELLKNSFKIIISSPLDNEKALEIFTEMNIKVSITKIDRRGINPIKDFLLLLKYFLLLRKEKPDIILTYTIKPNFYGGLMSKLLKIPYISNITGIGSFFQKKSVLVNIFKKFYKYSLKDAKCIFFQNSENLNFFLKNEIIKKNYKLINGSGVNLDKFKAPILKREEEDLKIIFIGRIMKEKGIEEFLEVAKRIKNKNKNIKFFILGALEEDEYKFKLEEFEKQDIIKYLGVSNDVREILKKVHCLVNPSWHEGMSNVLLEAGAMKKFLIASNISGCKEIVIDNFSGYLFEKNNVRELEEKINKLLHITDKEYEEIIENSYKHINKNFNRNNIVIEYIETIKN